MALLSHSHTLSVHSTAMARTKHVYRRRPNQLGLMLQQQSTAEQTEAEASRKRSRRGAPCAALARGSPRRRLSDSPPEPEPASRPQTPPGLAPPTAIRLAARCPPPSGGETTLVAGPQWTNLKLLSPRSSAALARLAAGKPPPPAPRCAACGTPPDSGPQGLRRHPTLPVGVCDRCLAAIRPQKTVSVRHRGPLVRSHSRSRRPQRPRSNPETGACHRRSSCACWRSTASAATPRADSRAHQQNRPARSLRSHRMHFARRCSGRPSGPPTPQRVIARTPLPSLSRFRA